MSGIVYRQVVSLTDTLGGLNIQVYGSLFKAKDIGDLLGIKDIRTTLRDWW